MEVFTRQRQNNKTAKILLTFFENGSAEQNREVIIKLKNLGLSDNINYTCTVLDENNDCVPIKQLVLTEAEELKLNLKMSLYGCYLLSFEV